MKLVPKNWGLFQHYKDRCPPWIKLHRDLLNDRKFICLPTASKALAPLLWLLASESKDGVFDASVPELEFRLRMTTEEIEVGLTGLICNGFFLDASTMLAPCLRPAIPETEAEAEAEAEAEDRGRGQRERKRQNLQPASPAAPKKARSGLSDDMKEVCREVWKAYSDAYFSRYKTEPVRNQKINRNVVDFCKRLAMHESPHVAAWYVSHSDAYYVRQMHSFGMLLKDCEKIRTEWATGQAMTQTKAKQVDRAGNTASIITEILADRRPTYEHENP